jgi:hypothetical protein
MSATRHNPSFAAQLRPQQLLVERRRLTAADRFAHSLPPATVARASASPARAATAGTTPGSWTCWAGLEGRFCDLAQHLRALR